jgi:hypothetical protein
VINETFKDISERNETLAGLTRFVPILEAESS